MNIEQEREAFEALERKRKGFGSDTLTRATIEPDDEYLLPLVQARWEGYQAGRAALQSQDRRDVTTLKAGLEEAAQTMRAVLVQERLKAVAKRCLSRAIVVCDRAIDHARRIEGDNDAAI